MEEKWLEKEIHDRAEARNAQNSTMVAMLSLMKCLSERLENN
jgi:hypothetical protein